MVNINFGRSKSIIVIFKKIIFAIELEFAKSAKFTAHENFALYGIKLILSDIIMYMYVQKYFTIKRIKKETCTLSLLSDMSFSGGSVACHNI